MGRAAWDYRGRVQLVRRGEEQRPEAAVAQVREDLRGLLRGDGPEVREAHGLRVT